MKTTILTLAAAILLAACSDPSSDARKPKGPEAAADVKDVEDDGDAPARKVGEWEILRAQLKRHVKRGGGEFLSKVRVRATFLRNRFYGWKVISYRGPGKKVRRGDIILRVNDKPIERDYQFLAVWNGLAKRDTLVVKLVRGGKPMVLRYKIVD